MVTTNNNVDDKLKTANDVSNVLNYFGGFRLFAVTTFFRLLIYKLQIFWPWTGKVFIILPT